MKLATLRGGLLALLGLVAALALTAPSAMATWTGHCEGENIAGEGSIVQKSAQLEWASKFLKSGDPTACGFAGPKVTHLSPYDADEALRWWGAFGENIFNPPAQGGKFLTTDIAPTLAIQVFGNLLQNIKISVKINTGKEPSVLTVPVTQTSIGIVANLPSGCTIAGMTPNDLEVVFRGTRLKWSELSTASGCGTSKIKRVVPRTSQLVGGKPVAGSTGYAYHFKHYLQQVNFNTTPCPEFPTIDTWRELQPNVERWGNPNPGTLWPESCVGEELSEIFFGNGAGATMQKVDETDGSVGFAPQTSLNASLPERPNVTVIPIYNGRAFVKPGTASGAANCARAEYNPPRRLVEKEIIDLASWSETNKPDLDWSEVYGTHLHAPGLTYSICMPTYVVALSKSLGVFGASAMFTIRDYLSYVVNHADQSDIANLGYAPLPPEMRQAANDAIDLIEGGTRPRTITGAASEKSASSATLNATINPRGTATSYQFEYGATTVYGSKVPAAMKSIGSGSEDVAVSEKIEGLKAGTTYHYRVIAENSEVGGGIAYGADQTFTAIGHCGGGTISGQGSSLQKVAQGLWSDDASLLPEGTSLTGVGFDNSKAKSACLGGPKVTYAVSGTGAGMHGWGADDGVLHSESTHFIATEEAPDGAQLERMKEALGSDLAVVPVTQTAISIVVNLPEKCTLTKITSPALQNAFNGTAATWAALGVSGTGCKKETPVTRVVPLEGSGATYQFKHYLYLLNASPLKCTGIAKQTWAQLQPNSAGGAPNTTWPRSSDCQSGEGSVTSVLNAVKAGDAALVDKVDATDGSIGFAALPDAKFNLDPATTGILSVQSNSMAEAEEGGTIYASPFNGGGSGPRANCDNAVYSLPKEWAGGLNLNWSGVYGAKIGGSSYPICTLSWVIAAANTTGAFGEGVGATQAQGEGVAISLRDYLGYVTTNETGGGQLDLEAAPRYYDRVPITVGEAAWAALGKIR